MDTVMEEKRGTYTALSLSLVLHVILLLAAGALGLFSIAVPQTGDTPVEVTLYDAGPPAAAAAGDAAPAPAVSAVSDVVIVDKTLPPETPQETKPQTSNPQTARRRGRRETAAAAAAVTQRGQGRRAEHPAHRAAEMQLPPLRPPRRQSALRRACGQRRHLSTRRNSSRMMSRAR